MAERQRSRRPIDPANVANDALRTIRKVLYYIEDHCEIVEEAKNSVAEVLNALIETWKALKNGGEEDLPEEFKFS